METTTMRRLPLFAAVWMLLATAAVAQVAAPPSLMNFQGRLAKPDGSPVADGAVTLQFSLFNAPTGGTLLWQRTLASVPVQNGTFAARLDFRAQGEVERRDDQRLRTPRRFGPRPTLRFA